MRLREFAVLEAANIATTQHQQRTPKDYLEKPLAERLAWNGYRATAAQIAETLAEDQRMRNDGLPILSVREVGAALARMNQGFPERRAALVEKVTTRHWRMTDAGVRALSARRSLESHHPQGTV